MLLWHDSSKEQRHKTEKNFNHLVFIVLVNLLIILQNKSFLRAFSYIKNSAKLLKKNG